MTAMEQSAYGLADYVADLRAIQAHGGTDSEIIEQVRPLALKLTANKAWVRKEFYTYDEEQGIGFNLLHEEEDHSLAVFAISWAPGGGAPPHNHGTWAVVTGVDGPELNTFWKRVDDGSRTGCAEIVKAGEKSFAEGEVVSLLPDAIHSVKNETDRVTLSLHTYGKHINFTGRSSFDPESNRMEPFVVKVD